MRAQPDASVPLEAAGVGGSGARPEPQVGCRCSGQVGGQVGGEQVGTCGPVSVSDGRSR